MGRILSSLEEARPKALRIVTDYWMLEGLVDQLHGDGVVLQPAARVSPNGDAVECDGPCWVAYGQGGLIIEQIDPQDLEWAKP